VRDCVTCEFLIEHRALAPGREVRREKSFKARTRGDKLS
jgi:hypothetical protein